MFKRTVVLCLVGIFLMVGILSVPVFAAQNEDAYSAVAVSKIIEKTNVNELKAKSAVLMDSASGSVLMESNSHEKLPIASVTKVMTMLLVMEAVDSKQISYSDMVPVGENAFRMGGSQVYLEPGEQFTVEQMLYAVAVGSANDASVAFAEMLAGSEEEFVARMNEKAKELGMNDSHFLDCTGLTDEGHYSSAYDIALVSRELITKHPDVLKFTSTWNVPFRENTPGKKPMSLYNTNKLVRHFGGTVGLKTGFTRASGYCLSAVVDRNNLRLIAVVLGEPDSNTRFAEVCKLMNYGFANYETTTISPRGEEMQEMEVKKGLGMKVKAVLPEDVTLLLKKGEKGQIDRQVKMDASIEAPVKKGQKLGEVVFTLDGKEVGKADLVASDDVQRASFIRLFFRMVMEWFGIGRASA